MHGNPLLHPQIEEYWSRRPTPVPSTPPTLGSAQLSRRRCAAPSPVPIARGHAEERWTGLARCPFLPPQPSHSSARASFGLAGIAHPASPPFSPSTSLELVGHGSGAWRLRGKAVNEERCGVCRWATAPRRCSPTPPAIRVMLPPPLSHAAVASSRFGGGRLGEAHLVPEVAHSQTIGCLHSSGGGSVGSGLEGTGSTGERRHGRGSVVAQSGECRRGPVASAALLRPSKMQYRCCLAVACTAETEIASVEEFKKESSPPWIARLVKVFASPASW
ncbi:hypothetical protein U9M48_011737 [Paspalum notatum var. saurae]|uniref:Uncharacterized protein n=1 Tax=Paspalum notatum var. saurae TaxID=547442 RepID=A0AAQ3WHN9_PASNO